MERIAVMGLVSWNNMGEQFLARNTEYLIGPEHEVRMIDFEPPGIRISEAFYYMFLVLSKLVRNKRISHKMVYKAVECRSRGYFRKKLKGCDRIVFACGSYKYGTQKLWAYYSVAIELAQKMNIPVMFNGVNIQDYNREDWRCRCLAKHTNYPCVKMFTTRDGEAGYSKFRRSYLTNKDIDVRMVGDPAFWIKECYGAERAKNPRVIGVNLIRGRIFEDYGKNISEERLVEIYCELLGKLDESNMEWELFTNGMTPDLQFGKKVLERYGKKGVAIRVPETDRELVETIAGYKAIAGARLHALICAYSLDVPMTGYIWDEKLLRFAEIAGLAPVFIKEEELSGNKIFSTLMEALNYRYDAGIREEWKQKTKASIDDFLKRRSI